MSKELNKAPVEQAEPASCQGTNCGTTTGDHSSECLAEAAASQGWELKPGDLCGRDCPMRPAPVEQAVGDERAAFEAAASKLGIYTCNFERYTEETAAHENRINARVEDPVRAGDYRSATLQDCWKVWQEARAALAQPSPAAVQLSGSRERRIYVAGPMTGYKDFNFPAFNAQAEELRGLGYHVENPAEHGIVDGAEWQDYLRYDIGRLSTCEAIFLLPGWSKSKGAALEVHIAKALGMTFIHHADAEHEQPSPAQAEQAEAERAEVVARVVHSNPVVLDQCGPLNANDELMTVAQHAASVARWAEMFNRVEQERDAALAKLAELEKQEPVGCRMSRSALTEAQMRRIYENSTEIENERLGFAAFARLMRRAEAVHQIAAAPGKEVGHE